MSERATPASLPAVTVIVLNWNAAGYLEACLASLLAQDYPAFRVLVVDNASTDDSLARARARFPDVPVIASRENAGFAAGNNLALKQLETPIAVLANPDIVVEPGWLSALIAPFLSDPRVGIAGGQTRYPDGTLQHAGGLIRPPQAIAAYRRPSPDEPAAMIDVDYVIGATLAVRRELLERVGPLDEGFFLYYEEADLCARARRAGYRVVYVPAARLVHVESATTPRGDATYLRRLHTSRWRYLLKHADEASLLGETMPAEVAWLAERNAVERQAAAIAYLATLGRLPEILAARGRDGAAPFDPDAAERAGLALERLFAVALAGDRAPLDALSAGQTVKEPPIRSRLPLVARLRERWVNLATRWYVRALWEQQNRFNELVVNRLADQQARLRAQAADHAALARGIAELEAEIARRRAGAGGQSSVRSRATVTPAPPSPSLPSSQETT